jgi:hypothetical protein
MDSYSRRSLQFAVFTFVLAEALAGPGQYFSSLRREDNLDTARFLDYLRSQFLASNVDLEEVQEMKLHDLKGVDEAIRHSLLHIGKLQKNDKIKLTLLVRLCLISALAERIQIE